MNDFAVGFVRSYAVRLYLVDLYARSTNLERMYLYNWGGTKLPIVLGLAGGSPTPAAIAVAQLEHWLANTSITSCGTGRSRVCRRTSGGAISPTTTTAARTHS